ncbi:MAG: ATP synthase subunit I [Candidatus Adiutrix sp.]
MTSRAIQKIEQWLFAKGFNIPLVRHILAVQIMLCLVSLGLGVLLVPITVWGISFGLGASIAMYHFWFLVRFIQKKFSNKYTAQTLLLLFLGFNVRLIATAFLLFGLIVWLKMPLAPLLAGLSSLVACIIVWGFSKLMRKPI